MHGARAPSIRRLCCVKTSKWTPKTPRAPIFPPEKAIGIDQSRIWTDASAHCTKYGQYTFFFFESAHVLDELNLAPRWFTARWWYWSKYQRHRLIYLFEAFFGRTLYMGILDRRERRAVYVHISTATGSQTTRCKTSQTARVGTPAPKCVVGDCQSQFRTAPSACCSNLGDVPPKR